MSRPRKPPSRRRASPSGGPVDQLNASMARLYLTYYNMAMGWKTGGKPMAEVVSDALDHYASNRPEADVAALEGAVYDLVCEETPIEETGEIDVSDHGKLADNAVVMALVHVFWGQGPDAPKCHV